MEKEVNHKLLTKVFSNRSFRAKNLQLYTYGPQRAIDPWHQLRAKGLTVLVSDRKGNNKVRDIGNETKLRKRPARSRQSRYSRTISEIKVTIDFCSNFVH